MNTQEDREDQRLLQMMEEQWKDRWSDSKKVSVYWLGKGGRFRMPQSQRVWTITRIESPSRVFASSGGNDIILDETTIVYPMS